MDVTQQDGVDGIRTIRVKLIGLSLMLYQMACRLDARVEHRQILREEARQVMHRAELVARLP